MTIFYEPQVSCTLIFLASVCVTCDLCLQRFSCNQNKKSQEEEKGYTDRPSFPKMGGKGVAFDHSPSLASGGGGVRAILDLKKFDRRFAPRMSKSIWYDIFKSKT